MNEENAKKVARNLKSTSTEDIYFPLNKKWHQNKYSREQLNFFERRDHDSDKTEGYKAKAHKYTGVYHSRKHKENKLTLKK